MYFGFSSTCIYFKSIWSFKTMLYCTFERLFWNRKKTPTIYIIAATVNHQVANIVVFLPGQIRSSIGIYVYFVKGNSNLICLFFNLPERNVLKYGNQTTCILFINTYAQLTRGQSLSTTLVAWSLLCTNNSFLSLSKCKGL